MFTMDEEKYFFFVIDEEIYKHIEYHYLSKFWTIYRILKVKQKKNLWNDQCIYHSYDYFSISIDIVCFGNTISIVCIVRALPNSSFASENVLSHIDIVLGCLIRRYLDTKLSNLRCLLVLNYKNNYIML